MTNIDSIKQILLSTLRNRTTSLEAFREATDKLSTLLAFETASLLDTQKYPLETPLTTSEGLKWRHPIVLIPILRGGMALLPAFLKMFPAAKVGFIGIRREESTALPITYYQNFPKIEPHEHVIILDPMIATGGSASETWQFLKNASILPEKVIFVGFVAAPEGLDRLKNEIPNSRFVLGKIDQNLNQHFFIVPGLGDFGDRYFGTESKE